MMQLDDFTTMPINIRMIQRIFYIVRSLEKNQADRYQDIVQMLDDFSGVNLSPVSHSNGDGLGSVPPFYHSEVNSMEVSLHIVKSG